MAGCTPNAPPPAPDLTRAAPERTPAYTAWVAELARLRVEIAALQREGRRDESARRLALAQQVAARLLAVPRPTLDGMKAVSALDELYARILLADGHIGWARLLFQKNAARWRTWSPATPESEKLRMEAEAGIAECDRRLTR